MTEFREAGADSTFICWPENSRLQWETVQLTPEKIINFLESDGVGITL